MRDRFSANSAAQNLEEHDHLPQRLGYRDLDLQSTQQATRGLLKSNVQPCMM